MISLIDVISTADKSQELEVGSKLTSVTYSGVEYPITGNKPFNICLNNDSNRRLLISGNTSVEVTIPCDRCLEEVNVILDLVIEKVIPISDGHLVAEDDEELLFICEDELDVDRLVFDEILVNWPTKVLCKDDCKGLCPVCGQNLNQRDCGCDRQVIDPRMAKFQDIFNEFKEV